MGYNDWCWEVPRFYPDTSLISSNSWLWCPLSTVHSRLPHISNHNSATTERSSSLLSLSRRHGGGHHRTWARVSLSGLTRRRRGDKEPKGLTVRSPSRRITLGGALREEGVGAGGAAFHGQHGIRYQQTLSENSLDMLNQEEVRVLASHGCKPRIGLR